MYSQMLPPWISPKRTEIMSPSNCRRRTGNLIWKHECIPKLWDPPHGKQCQNILVDGNQRSTVIQLQWIHRCQTPGHESTISKLSRILRHEYLNTDQLFRLFTKTSQNNGRTILRESHCYSSILIVHTRGSIVKTDAILWKNYSGETDVSKLHYLCLRPYATFQNPCQNVNEKIEWNLGSSDWTNKTATTALFTAFPDYRTEGDCGVFIYMHP